MFNIMRQRLNIDRSKFIAHNVYLHVNLLMMTSVVAPVHTHSFAET